MACLASLVYALSSPSCGDRHSFKLFENLCGMNGPESY